MAIIIVITIINALQPKTTGSTLVVEQGGFIAHYSEEGHAT